MQEVERLPKNTLDMFGLEKNRGIISDILSVLPVQEHYCVATDFRLADNKAAVSVAPMIKKACAMLAKKADMGHGYFIELRNEFLYGNGQKDPVVFSGLYLTLLCPDKKQVGVLDFLVGWPFEIIAIHGQYGGGPRKFFCTTGKPFDTALLQHLVKCIGSTAHLPAGDPWAGIPAAEFNLLSVMRNKEMLKRHAECIPTSERAEFMSKNGMLRQRLRPQLFAHEWGKAQRTKMALAR